MVICTTVKHGWAQKIQPKGSISERHLLAAACSFWLTNRSPSIFSTCNKQWLWFGHFSIQAIWEAAKWNGIHPALLMENPKSIDASLWNRQGPWVPSCGWRAYPNNPGQIACFSAAQLLKKSTDRHTDMDNKKKHVCTVSVCVCLWLMQPCVYSMCVWVHGCGKERKRKKSRLGSPPVDQNQPKTKWSSYGLLTLLAWTESHLQKEKLSNPHSSSALTTF